MNEPAYSWEPAAHTADLAIAIYASEKIGLFHAAFEGLLGSLEFDRSAPSIDSITEHPLNLNTSGIEEALVDFLNECIYIMEVNDVIPFKLHSLDYSDDVLNAVFLCRPIQENELPEIGHIKAATYSDLVVTETDRGFQARIIFDT